MRVLLFSVLGALLAATSLPAMTISDPLDPFHWENRVVLVFGEAGAAETLRAAKAGIDERHIIWFVHAKGELQTNFPGELSPHFAEELAQAYRTAEPPKTETVLVGKDGGVKSRDPKLDLEVIYARIDAMPMRRAEMRRQARDTDQ